MAARRRRTLTQTQGSAPGGGTGSSESGATVNSLSMPTVPGSPTLGAPPGGATEVAAGGTAIVSALANAASGSTILLRSGDHTLSSNGTLTASNVIVRSYPGERARIIGGNQLRILGNNNTLYEVFLDTRSVPGKHMEVTGTGHKIWRNKFDTGHTGSTGGYGTCVYIGSSASDLYFEGNWWNHIGQTDDTNIFDHAIYLESVNPALISRNMFTDVTGGYCFHAYNGGGGSSAVNCVFEKNRIWNSYGIMHANGSSNNTARYNAFQWDLTTAVKPPVVDVYSPAGNLYVDHNAIYTAYTGYGTDGIYEDVTVIESNHLLASAQFPSPSTGDMRVMNAAVSDFLGFS